MPAPSSAPGNFVAVAFNAYANLSWDSVAGATYYEVAAGTSPNPTNWFNVGNVTSYELGGLQNNTTYYVRVRAGNADGSGPPTSDAAITPANSSGFAQWDCDNGWRKPNQGITTSVYNRSYLNVGSSDYLYLVEGIRHNASYNFPNAWLKLGASWPLRRIRARIRETSASPLGTLVLYFRSNASSWGNNWEVRWLASGALQLNEVTADSSVTRASTTLTRAVGTYLFEITDDTNGLITVKVNGSTVLTHTSTAKRTSAYDYIGFELGTINNTLRITWISWDVTGSATPVELGMAVQATSSVTAKATRRRPVALAAAAGSSPVFRLTRRKKVQLAASAQASPTLAILKAKRLQLGVSATSTVEVGAIKRYRGVRAPLAASVAFSSRLVQSHRLRWAPSAQVTFAPKLKNGYRLQLTTGASASSVFTLSRPKRLALATAATAKGTFGLFAGNADPWRDTAFDIIPTLYIADQNGVMQDRTSYFDEMSLYESVDDYGPSATLILRPGLSSNALDLVRKVRVLVTLRSRLTQLTRSFALFEGYIDSIDYEADPWRVECRGLFAELLDKFITEEREYGSDSGTALDAVIRSLLDDNGFASLPFDSQMSEGSGGSAYYPDPSGTTYWVSTSGNDSNPGTQAAPFRTINRGIAAVSAGGVVRVMDGTYAEWVRVNKSGTAGSRITIISHNKHGAKINATGNDYGITLEGSYIDVIGFEVYGANRVGILSWNYNSSNPYYGNRIMWNRVRTMNPVCDSDGGAGIVMSSYSLNGVISHNIVHDIGNVALGYCTRIHGIYNQASGTVVANNIAYRCRGYGFDNWHRVQNSIYLNNLAFANLYGGMSFGTESSYGILVTGCYIANNILVNNGYYGVQEVENVQAGGMTYVNNLVWGHTTNWSLLGNTHTGSLNANPLFVNYQADGSGDYHLQASSPCVNYGVSNANLPTYDLDGLPRVVGAAVDLGPYEYGSSAPSGSAVMIKRYRQARMPLLAAIRQLANQCGWDVRYVYNGSQWRFTLLEPKRNNTIPDYILRSSDYFEVSKLRRDVGFIRNSVAVVYGPPDNRYRYTATDAISISKYKERHMEIAEASTSIINTAQEAQRLAEIALSDLSDAEYYAIATPFAPQLSVLQLILLKANGYNVPADRTFGIASIRHTLGRNPGTVIEGRANRVVGAIEGWLRKEASRATDTLEHGGVPGESPPSLPVVTGLAASTYLDTVNQSTFAYATLTWNPLPMNLLSHYEVAIRKQGDTLWTPYTARDNYLRITTLPGGSTVEARVRAVAADDRRTTSAWSSTISFTLPNDTQAPYYGTTVPTPTGRTVKAGIEVQWPDVASSYPDYVKTEIQVRHSSESYHATAMSAVAYGTKVEISRYVNASGTNVLMTPGFTYYARVRHVDATGNASAWSSETSAVCGQIEGADVNPNAPAQPSGFALASTQVIQDSQGQHSVNVNFTWNSLSDSLLAGFALYYRLNGQTNWTLGTTVLASATEGRIEGLATGATYDFGIRSVSRFGAMSAITVISAQTMPSDSSAPPTPTGVGIQSIAGGVRVYWNLAALASVRDYKCTEIDLYLGGNYAGRYEAVGDWTVTTLGGGQNVQVYVRHKDFSGNVSAWSGPHSVTSGYVTTGLIASGAVSQYEALQVEDVFGTFTSSSSYVVVPGMSLTFVLQEPSLCFFGFNAAAYKDRSLPFFNRAGSIVAYLDNVPVAHTVRNFLQFDQNTDPYNDSPHVSLTWLSYLNAGTYTIDIRFASTGTSFGLGNRNLFVLILKR